MVWDFMGPHYFAPMNCISVEDDKYDSPIIGYIKNDKSVLQANMLAVLKSLMYDQQRAVKILKDLQKISRDYNFDMALNIANSVNSPGGDGEYFVDPDIIY